jgi:hypothetical protein
MSSVAEKSADTKKPRRAQKARDFGITHDADGVKVEQLNDGYLVKFDFNHGLIGKIRKVEGVKFDRNAQGWIVPTDQLEQLKPAVAAMRKEFLLDQEARFAIEAQTDGMSLMKADVIARGIKPQISDYMSTDGSRGPIIAVNSRYAAQHTGNGADGAAFVTIHALAALDEPLFKGDRVLIKYDGATLKGKVAHVQTKEERENAFDNSMGQNIDGVRVRHENGKYLVEFDYNPTLSDRIRRIDGAEFSNDVKAWTVGEDKKEFVVRAVSEMRREVVADREDRANLETLAGIKIDGVKVKDAFTKDGTATTGQVLGRNDRYVLQHTGKDYVALHRASAFEDAPEVGSNIRVEYKTGKAKVGDRGQSKSQAHER